MQGRKFFARANRGAAPTPHDTLSPHTSARAAAAALVCVALAMSMTSCVRTVDSAHAAPTRPATPTRGPRTTPPPKQRQTPTTRPAPQRHHTPTRTPDAPKAAPHTPTPTRSKQPRRTGQQPHSHERTKVYRNSKDFAFLDTARMVVPGGKYFTDTGSCSFGFFAASGADSSRIFNLTAGHCGTRGDKVYVLDGAGSRIQVGAFVESHPRTLDGRDWALIEMFVEPDMYSPPVTVALTDWASTKALADRGGYICALGFRSGLSCGDFDRFVTPDLFLSSGIRDHGDSGGPVWILEEKKSYAVGMASSIDYSDGAGMYITTIDAAVDRFHLRLLADQ